MVIPFETAGVPGSEGSFPDTFQPLLRRIPDCLTLQFLLFISCLTQREGCLMDPFLQLLSPSLTHLHTETLLAEGW